MEFKEVVKNRFSCKKYSSRKLEAAKLEAILPLPRICRSSTCTSSSRKRCWQRLMA